ncbi:copper resistance CopC family protein [Actinomadura xylanilytica]|uniref:copper resistance CopC family protein n=1 Tax=Actinomadura xylanilytica TaxID=887459 RepID=UPI00255B0D08|nr:copper resistance protein CopC [Actinomadura xylanilytica]MDL4773235.1 copper resistance protein CopC [Actinomadura xylanilytica]
MRRPAAAPLPAVTALVFTALASTVLASTVLTLVAAPPASAHTTLRSSTPAPGSTARAPSSIELTYADPVMVPKVVLSDTNGGQHAAGPARAVDNKVTQAVDGTLPNGVYTVGWRVVSVDGHPVTGSYTFTVRGSTSATSAKTDAPTSAPASASASAGPAAGAPEGSGGSSGWLWIGLVAAVVVLAAGGVALVRRR